MLVVSSNAKRFRAASPHNPTLRTLAASNPRDRLGGKDPTARFTDPGSAPALVGIATPANPGIKAQREVRHNSRVRTRRSKTPPTTGGVLESDGCFGSVRLTAGCHRVGKTWDFVSVAGNRWNPIPRDGCATFSLFTGDS